MHDGVFAVDKLVGKRQLRVGLGTQAEHLPQMDIAPRVPVEVKHLGPSLGAFASGGFDGFEVISPPLGH